ncbi:hypothetical protein JOQ06_009886 [Pogonophryne albipinna]|uniref:Uncharacterized protein n=1 Tax=Pogonophryne albipinna TaxID=1090488 RepID=A0AAD6BP88_9TELE|nr:hypothetical protein JOQ06_009886 [Pogonophryne albipinna]
MGLKKAWEKKILMEGRRLSFNHDYATEVVLKRKAYVGIKRVLKEKNIRFQTPLDSMRIHWDSGTGTYDSAPDAAQELRRRGFSVEIPDCNALELYLEMEPSGTGSLVRVQGIMKKENYDDILRDNMNKSALSLRSSLGLPTRQRSKAHINLGPTVPKGHQNQGAGVARTEPRS